ncbi:MAG: helix-turn-helix domain-containing protein, partial [Pseudonocardia sp.]
MDERTSALGDDRTIGQRLRRIRTVRGKSLAVIAGLAGISESHLSRLETGDRALDRLSLVVTLADALQIAPSELTSLPIPAPANGHTDSSIEAIRLALDAIDVDHPGGLVLPVAVLRDRVTQIHAQRRASQFVEVATGLPGLIRDLHTTLATGTGHGEVLTLAVYLHVHVTRPWLSVAAAPADLCRRAVFLARRLAQEHGEVTMLGMAGFAVADTLLFGGAFEPGRAELDVLTLPPTTADTAGLVCWLTAAHGLVAVLDGRPNDAAAPMDATAEIAGRFGATGAADALGIVFGPINVGMNRMFNALESGEPDRAVSIAQDVDPDRHPFPSVRAFYWAHHGRALVQLRGRDDDAVRALRTAEGLYPTKVQRDPLV